MYDGAMLSFAYGMTAFVVLSAVAGLIGVTVRKCKGAHKQMEKSKLR